MTRLRNQYVVKTVDTPKYVPVRTKGRNMEIVKETLILVGVFLLALLPVIVLKIVIVLKLWDKLTKE